MRLRDHSGLDFEDLPVAEWDSLDHRLLGVPFLDHSRCGIDLFPDSREWVEALRLISNSRLWWRRGRSCLSGRERGGGYELIDHVHGVLWRPR